MLSDENRELLRIIHDSKPGSIAELEQMTGRKVSNLSRTLRTLANYGLVRLEGGSQGRGRRAVKPVAVARSINLSLDIGFGEKPAPRRPVRDRAMKSGRSPRRQTAAINLRRRAKARCSAALGFADESRARAKRS